MVSPIPAVLSAVSIGFLHSTNKLNEITESFFTHLSVLEQVCVASIFFSIIHVAISISKFMVAANDGDEEGSHHSHHEEDIYAAYPFEQMQLAANKQYRFGAMFPTLMVEISDHLRDSNVQLETIESIEDVMEPFYPGQIECGITVVEVYRLMVKAKVRRDMSFLEEAKATVLGWAMLMMFYSNATIESKVEVNENRIKGPEFAVNLESFVFFIIRKHFHDEAYYHNLMELFLELKEILNTSHCHSLLQASDSSLSLERNTSNFCTFYLPVAIGMILSNIKDERAYDEAKNICRRLDAAEAFKSVKFCEVKGGDNVPSDVFELVYERRSNNCMYKSSK